MLFLMILLPIIASIFLYRNSRTLDQPHMLKKYQNLYPQVNITIQKGIYNYPVFLLRRLLFVIIPALVYESRDLRVHLLYIVMYAYSIWFVK